MKKAMSNLYLYLIGLKFKRKLIGIKYNNAYVIPCNIDTDIFKYNEKI